MYNLCRARCNAVRCERSDKRRVAHFDEGVVDVVQKDEPDALFDEPGERSAHGERAKATAVSVRDFDRVPVRVEKRRPVGPERCERSLVKEPDVVAVVSEVGMFLKMFDGLFPVERRGHYGPWDRLSGLGSQVHQSPGDEPKKRSVTRKPKIVGAFGTFESEPRALTAGERKRGDRSLFQKEASRLPEKFQTFVPGGERKRHRADFVRGLRCGRGFGGKLLVKLLGE